MLTAGTKISYNTEGHEDQSQTGTVKSCNKRGTTCVVELRPGETQIINLNKRQYTILNRAGDSEAAEGELEERLLNGDAESIDPEEGTGLPALDAFDRDTGKSVDAFCSAAHGPEAFARPSAEVAALARLAAKALYEWTASTAPAGDAVLPELYVDGFDAEQIWGQLDAFSGPALKRLRKQVKRLGPDILLLDPETEEALEELLASYADANEEEEQEPPMEQEIDDAENPSSGSGSDEEADREPESRGPARKQAPLRAEVAPSADADQERLPTEDEFLRLNDMERFVQDAEEAALNADDAAESQEDGDEDEEEEEQDGSELEGLDALGGEESNSDEEDAELARLLESASEIVGRQPPQPGKRRRRGTDNDEDGAAGDIMYEDFFGAGGQASGRQRAEQAAAQDLEDFELDSDLEGADAEAADSEEGSEDPADAFSPDGGRQEGGREAPPAEDDGGGDGGRTAGGRTAGGVASAHERRMARMAERARRLEEENLGEKEWFMRGEAGARARPLNSALEIDLDFDRALRPPPPPTEEATATLEDMIKRRIAERRFDDPQRSAPPADDLQKELAELDDKRSSKGLGEVYEAEYVRAKTGNALEDKDEKTRAEARALLKGLFARLDALSHFHFAPKPIVQEMAVRSEVPALAMEEVAPQVVSEASRQRPEEVYVAPKRSMSEAEEKAMTHSDRRRVRAAKKRTFKKRQDHQEVEKRAQGILPDGTSNIIGRKSAEHDAAELAAAKKAKKSKKRKAQEAAAPPKIKYTKSAAVFGHIQDARDAKLPRKEANVALKAANLKL